MKKFIYKHYKKIILILMFYLLLFGCLYLFLDNSGMTTIAKKYWSNYGNFEITDKAENIKLSRPQKKKDIETFCDVLRTSVAALPYYEEVYGFSLDELEQMWVTEISNTKSEYEYWGTLNAIIDSFPSPHSALLLPDYNNYCNISSSYYNMPKLILENDMQEYTNMWQAIITERCEEEYANREQIYFIYNGTDMIYSGTFNGDKKDFYRLVSINGESIESYIKSHITSGKLRYDHYNNTVYKDTIFLYPESSETSHQVEVEIENTNSEINKHILYIDYCADTAIEKAYAKHYNNGDIPVEKQYCVTKPLYYYTVNDKDLIYMSFYYFNNESAEKFNEIISRRNQNKIIIDLRYCSGGFISVVTDTLYPALFSGRRIYEREFYIPKSKYTLQHNEEMSIINSIKIRLWHFDNPFNDKSLMTEQIRYDLIGKADKQKKVYLITGTGTVSAADLFTDICKQEENTVVLGGKTGGEGIGEWIYSEKLPNSRLIFLYDPTFSFNSEGKVNSIFGTSPNVNITNSNTDTLDVLNEMLKNGDPYTFTNRLKWDNVLIKTLELIKEDENDKGNNTADE